jgi:quinoprotein glucose dehydrogenase
MTKKRSALGTWGIGVAGSAAACIAVIACSDGRSSVPASDTTVSAAEWPAYGNDAGGSRWSPAAQITRENVGDLREAWRVSTGDATHDDGSEGAQSGCGACHTSDSKFEATPLLVDGRLFVSTPLNRVLALDPRSGELLWRYDPRIATDIERNEGFVSRGVSHWSGAGDGPCSSRVFLGTIDARLIALDAESGEPCDGFGDGGTVRLDEGVGEVQVGQYGVTSPPAIVHGLVVVGSSMGDNRRVDMERGVVRAYDARSGTLRWTFDPIPRGPDDPSWADWSPEAAAKTGAANAWAPLSADPERDLVFVPTGSAAPDFYGGERPGDNRFANSVVALRASTGEVVWHFQVVHHDLWDYDVAAQPSLADVPRDGGSVPAVVVATKMGLVYVLNRETGEPLFPVEERPVPVSDVPGERASPTQPFPTLPEPLHPQGWDPGSAWGPTPADLESCRAQAGGLRNEGMFTPPSLQGTVLYPGYAGGVNWGGVAIDRERSRMVVNVSRIPVWVRLREREREGAGNQLGTPYVMEREMLTGPSGTLCSPPPWGTLVAVDLTTGALAWEVPFGRVPALRELPGAERMGSPSLGGPIVTSAGLVFIGAAMDDAIRAFDIRTGEEVWRHELPAGGQATPMTYVVDGKQYVVIAAGGHGSIGTTFGDWVVAFALP